MYNISFMYQSHVLRENGMIETVVKTKMLNAISWTNQS